MIPADFPEKTKTLHAPEGMDDCEPLHVWNDGQTCISKWTTVSFWDRVKFLFHGTIWLRVVSGHTQPPVALDCKATIFTPPEPEEDGPYDHLDSGRTIQ